MMNLEQLKSLGGIVGQEPVTAAVEWKGQQFDVRIRKLSYGTVETLRNTGGDAFNTHLLAACVVLGDDPLSYEDAFRLDPTLAAALLAAINTVHEGVADPKPATSGTN